MGLFCSINCLLTDFENHLVNIVDELAPLAEHINTNIVKMPKSLTFESAL